MTITDRDRMRELTRASWWPTQSHSGTNWDAIAEDLRMRSRGARMLGQWAEANEFARLAGIASAQGY